MDDLLSPQQISAFLCPIPYVLKRRSRTGDSPPWVARGLEDRFGWMIDEDQCAEIANTALRFIESNGDVDGPESDAIANDFCQTLFLSMHVLGLSLGAPMNDEDHRVYLWRVLDILDALTPGLKGGTVATTRAMRRVWDAEGWRPDGPLKPCDEWD